ncbi:MAG: DUF2797 domain-containing protein [Gammaproteobacteria bacterium]|nr:DUF2797 domain-containing protein [Gammaproteobacteria bacterium]
MVYQGTLRKMLTRLGPLVEYQLPLAQETIPLQGYLGKTIEIRWKGKIHCIHCGRETRKSFSQGFCYPCFKTLAQCDVCMVSPEKCHFDQGTCREPDWAQDHCMQPHIVYLSNTSGIKVGITRASQIPIRWIDQGAVEALAVLKVSKRFYAGLVEDEFKQYLNDKTNWRRMLKNEYEQEDLKQVFERIWPKVKHQLSNALLADIEVLANTEIQQQLQYPALEYPTKVTSYNLEKTPRIKDQLKAIKGQYLIFEQGVINIRKYAGYDVEVEIF